MHKHISKKICSFFSRILLFLLKEMYDLHVELKSKKYLLLVKMMWNLLLIFLMFYQHAKCDLKTLYNKTTCYFFHF